MAGIGFALRRLVQEDRFSSNLAGLGYATIASSGPWIFTCMAIVVLEQLGRQLLDESILRRFSVLIVYAFSFSFVIAGPVVLVVTRRLADCLYARDVREVTGMLLGALSVVFGALALFGIPFYGWVLDVQPHERVLGLLTLFVAGAVWLVSTFISALKSYSTVAAAFAVGMAVCVLCAAASASRFGGAGLLGSFMIGLAVIFFVLVARVFAEYPAPIVWPFGFLRHVRRYRYLAVVGLVYSASAWIDKWVMWWAPGAIEPAGGVHSHPAYEGAMFLASLSMVPAIALLLVEVESRFYAVYRRYYLDVSRHATLQDIRRNHRVMVDVMVGSLRRLGAMQAAVCLIGILGAPAIVSLAGGGIEMVSILRFGLLGALFHMLLIMAMAALAYFDMQRSMVRLALLFLALNGSLTAMSGVMGREYHGYGYFLACLVSFAVACLTSVRHIARLPYLTFVANNPSVVAPIETEAARAEQRSAQEG